MCTSWVTGASGSGCWYRPGAAGPRLASPFHAPGLRASDQSALRQDLDTLYAERLLALVQASSLDHVVILAQEEPYAASGKKLEGEGSFYVPNSYVLRLAAAHPEFLAGISIHPARADALEELELGLAGGAVLLKCLPNCQNIDWSDRRYTRFLERMAEAKLPLLAHTGRRAFAAGASIARLADPRVLIRPWKSASGACIAAHCGPRRAGCSIGDYFGVFIEMLAQVSDPVAATTAPSAAPQRPAAGKTSRTLPASRRSPAASCTGATRRFPSSGTRPFCRGLISRRAFGESRRESNPLERDYQLKRAMGFPRKASPAPPKADPAAGPLPFSMKTPTSRRFLPLFVTQFIGAFCDNVFKNAFVLLSTFGLAQAHGWNPADAVYLIGGLFILPFVLISGWAGYVSDLWARHTLVRRLKTFEAFVMPGRGRRALCQQLLRDVGDHHRLGVHLRPCLARSSMGSSPST